MIFLLLALYNTLHEFLAFFADKEKWQMAKKLQVSTST